MMSLCASFDSETCRALERREIKRTRRWCSRVVGVVDGVWYNFQVYGRTLQKCVLYRRGVCAGCVLASKHE